MQMQYEQLQWKWNTKRTISPKVALKNIEQPWIWRLKRSERNLIIISMGESGGLLLKKRREKSIYGTRDKVLTNKTFHFMQYSIGFWHDAELQLSLAGSLLLCHGQCSVKLCEHQHNHWMQFITLHFSPSSRNMAVILLLAAFLWAAIYRNRGGVRVSL